MLGDRLGGKCCTRESGQEILRLGAGPYGGAHIVPHLLRAYLAAHPDADVRLTADD